MLTCQTGPSLGGPVRFLEEIILRVRHKGAQELMCFSDGQKGDGVEDIILGWKERKNG